ncbi:MAG: hypothetical protein GX971_11945 [Firmicutes bacterium]|nr:hypothetical protein [Bacillota bacterium]
MKNRLWSLYCALLNDHYGWSAGKYYYLKKRQRIWEPILIAVAFLPLVVLAVVFIWNLTESLFLGGLAFGQPHLALMNGSLLVALAGLFFGFFYVLSAFYFSNDLVVLVPLPLRAWEILLAKLGVVLTGQYVLNALILIPLWLRYGLLAQVGIGYIVSALVVFLVLPVLPLVIASLLTVLLMRFVNISRHKDKLTLFGGIALLVVVFGFQFWLQNSLGSGDPEVIMQQLLSQADGIIKAMGRIFPPSLWAAQAMAYAHAAQGWINLTYLVLSSVVGIGILYLIGNKVFLQGLVAGLEGSRGSSRKHKVKVEQEAKSPLVTLASIERKLFVRDPGFALNGLVGYVLFPVMAFLPILGQSMEGNPFEQFNFQGVPPLLVMGGVALFFMVMTAMSMIPSTTFSREGRYLWIIRTLPVSISQIITTRVVAAQVVNTIGCLVGVIPLAYVFGWGVLEVVLGSIYGVLLASALAHLLVLLDLRRPMVDWVNPVKAVKSNLNAVLGFFGAFALAFALGVLFYLNTTTNTQWLIPLELLLVTVLLGALSRFLMKHWAQKLWARIGG